MGYIRRTHISHTMDCFRYPLLHYHHWYSVRRSVLQACRSLLLAYGQRNLISSGWFRQCPWKYSVDRCFRLGTRPDTSCNRRNILHHNHRHTFRPPMLQVGAGIIVPVWRYVQIKKTAFFSSKALCAKETHPNSKYKFLAPAGCSLRKKHIW